MYTLKIVRAGNYEDNGLIVREEEVYHEVGLKPEILMYKFVDTSSPIAKVIGENDEVLIYQDESAYLVNEQGKTLKIINRVGVINS